MIEERKQGNRMDALARLLDLSAAERETLGVVHTLPEVLQQPKTWGHTYDRVLDLAPRLSRFLTSAVLGSISEHPFNVVLVGAGTSDYIGRSVSALLRKQWSCDVQAIPSTDLLTNMDEHLVSGRSYLWISFSRSGDSSEGVAVLREGLSRYPKINHLIITCNREGEMARSFNDYTNVFSVVLDDVVNDRGLAMTSSFSNMVIAAQALAHLQNLEEYREVLDKLIVCASETMSTAANLCEDLVQRGFSKVCFLGSGSLKAAAIESALKVLELTSGRVMSLSESFLGLRHGPLSAIDQETLVVGFLSGDERRRAFELDLLREIEDKRLTSKLLAVSPAETQHIGGNSLCLGLDETVLDFYRPPVDVLVGQLLGFFSSLKEGLKPDTPSPQGAINRVVSHVTIH